MESQDTEGYNLKLGSLAACGDRNIHAAQLQKRQQVGSLPEGGLRGRWDGVHDPSGTWHAASSGACERPAFWGDPAVPFVPLSALQPMVGVG